MKKILTLLVALLMVFSLVGCSKKADAPATTDTPAAKAVKVGVTIYKFDDNFMTLYRNEMESYIKTLGNYEITIQDGKNDMAEQTNQIDNFIAQGYDVLVINLVQSSSASTIISKCADAGIPCVFINREPSAEDMAAHDNDDYAGKYCYVGADARQSGKFQGEIVAELENKGDLNGDGKLQYIMVEGDPENVDAQYRTEFSISQYIEKSGLEVECLTDQVGNWDQAKGQQIVADALAQFGDKIEVVFCNNDGMALGAYQAIVDAGRTVGEDIYLLGVDALDEVVDMVNAGTMTGTVLNDHVSQAHTAIDCAIKAVNGEKLVHNYTVDYVKVTK